MKVSASGIPGKGHDGFIIVAVLWILGALATLASIYAMYVVNTAKVLGANDDRLQAEALVSAGIELAAHQITAVPKDRRLGAGAFSFRMNQATVAVAFRAETARIDINAAEKPLLTGLFASLGAAGPDADYFADRVTAWRTPTVAGATDPEASAYRLAGLTYAPRGGGFPHTGELSAVMGLPPAIVDRMQSLVTVYSGKAQVNALLATPEVIAALPGMTPESVYNFLARRAAAPLDPQVIAALPLPAQASVTTENGRASRVTVRIAFDNGSRASSEVVIVVFDDQAAPYHVLSWRDEYE